VLSLAYAWAYLNAGELDAARSRLLDVEQWLEPVVDGDDWPEVPSEMVVVDEEQSHALPVSLATARAYHAQAIGDVAGTVKYAHRVLELLPEGDEYEQGTATALLGLAQWASGDLEAAHRTFSDGLAGMKPLDMIIGTFVLADIKTVLGQLNEAVRACERALQLAMDHGEPRPLGTEDVYIAISKLHREWGELEVAAQDLAKARELGEQIELPDWQHRWCIAQAGLLEAQGDLDGALEQLNEAERFFVRTPVPDVRPIMAKRARIWIRQDRLVEAVVWAREQELSTDDDLSYLREFEHLTLARLLIARHESNQLEGAIQDALRLLEGLLEAAEEGERMGSVIEILVLQAIAHEARGDISAALQFLERALALAEPEGYLRIFLDEGPPMATLLGEAAKQGAASGYVGKLRAAFERVGALNPGVQPLIEPLSKRELEVLRLLSTELNGPEIARQLHVSLNTMRTHTKNIYSKLEVNDRQSAVHRAQELGLI
jgi:LuxR family maltose regulon positive regulatory protein